MAKINFGWRAPDYPFDGSTASEFRDQIFAYLDAIQGKFQSAWVADHFVPWDRAQDQMTDTLECWTALTYLAARAPALSFGSIVMSQSYRPPALLAKMGAILQMLSGGRYILGIGAGWKEDEYRAYGYEFPSGAERIHQLEEAVQIIRKMWNEPRATFRGRYYHIEDAICQPKPDPLPPVMIGGGGRKLTLRVVARWADWWNIGNSTSEEYQQLLDVLAGHCREVGRNYDEIVKTYSADCVAVAPTIEKAQEIASASPLYGFGHMSGTPEQVAAQLRKFTDLGVQHLILRFADYPKTDCAMLFAREVMPMFA
jgi:alkanesulfonate monooxygenase SsuD/methylene tetrahydromethanopterin reductase-like flavin-dependent oxidoreductase (luciferase family)